MTGKVYYEHEPTNTAYLSAELYTIPGGGDGDEDEETTIDCAQAGTPIATQRYNAQTFATPGYNAVHAAMDATECFPQTATGVVSAFEFVLQEPYVQRRCRDVCVCVTSFVRYHIFLRSDFTHRTSSSSSSSSLFLVRFGWCV